MKRLWCVCAVVGLQSFAMFTTTTAQAQANRPSAILCDSWARSYSQQASRQGQVLRAGAGGSLIGLGLGALAGASGVGAAIGATVGVIGGGAKRQQTAERIYQAAYTDCMAGRIK